MSETTELHWPRKGTFQDHQRDAEYDGPGTFEVPAEAEDQYLDRGWEQPEDTDAADAPAAVSQEAASEETEEDAGFDAEAFVDDSWQAVVAQIEEGAADGHLAAVEEAEQNRDGDPRESVIEAIEARR